ncbi:MAG: putative glycolipid-binding domain-containing protein [Thermoplasmataceae archaeon]
MFHEDIYWKGIQPRGLEHLRLDWDCQISADGILIAENPTENKMDYFSLQYYLQADNNLATQEWNIQCFWNGQTLKLYLNFDGSQWSGHLNGMRLQNIPKAKYVDLSCTPFTNIFPIRELLLSGKQDITTDVLYIESPSLMVKASRQTYSKVSTTEFRYSPLSSTKKYEIKTNSFGVVTKYDNLWEII